MCPVDCGPLCTLFRKPKTPRPNNTVIIQLTSRPRPVNVPANHPLTPGSTIATVGGTSPSQAHSGRSIWDVSEGRERRATIPLRGHHSQSANPAPRLQAADVQLPRANTDPLWPHRCYAEQPYPPEGCHMCQQQARENPVPGAWPVSELEAPVPAPMPVAYTDNASHASFVRERTGIPRNQQGGTGPVEHKDLMLPEPRIDRVTSNRVNDWDTQLPTSPHSVVAASQEAGAVGGKDAKGKAKKDSEGQKGGQDKEKPTGRRHVRWVHDRKGNIRVEARRSRD